MAPAGERFTMAPPRVIGEGNHRTLEGVGRSIFIACLADARVRGRSAFIEAGGAALLDYQDDEFTRFDDSLTLDPAVFSVVDDRELWMIEPTQENCSVQIDEAFTLLGPYTRAFGHWIWQSPSSYWSIHVGSAAGCPGFDPHGNAQHTQTSPGAHAATGGADHRAGPVPDRPGTSAVVCARSMHLPVFGKFDERAR